MFMAQVQKLTSASMLTFTHVRGRAKSSLQCARGGSLRRRCFKCCWWGASHSRLSVRASTGKPRSERGYLQGECVLGRQTSGLDSSMQRRSGVFLCAQYHPCPGGDVPCGDEARRSRPSPSRAQTDGNLKRYFKSVPARDSEVRTSVGGGGAADRRQSQGASARNKREGIGVVPPAARWGAASRTPRGADGGL